MNPNFEKNLPWAALFARLSIGLLLLFAGLNKFMRPGPIGDVVGGLAGGFQETWLPMALVWPASWAIPFAEVALGALLVLGFALRPVLILSMFLLLNLAFGKIMQGDHGTVANNIQYVFFTGIALLLSPWDRFSVDGAMRQAKP